MVTKIRLFLVFLLFAFFAPLLQAQTDFYIDQSGDTPRFIQRIAWSGGEGASRYEIIIEKQEGRRFVSHHREFTRELFVEMSLPPGNYRFRIIPYDILNRANTGTEWSALEVRHALQPEVFDTTQEATLIDTGKGQVINLEGKNLLPDSEIYFRGPNGEIVVPVEVITSEDGNNVSLVFDDKQLKTGEYEIMIRNPGGLETNIGGVIHKAARRIPFILNISASWMPLIPIYGEGYGDDILPIGAALRISAGFPIPKDTHIGPELTATWFMNNIDETEHIVNVGLNFFVMKWLPQQITALSFRYGVEYTVMPTDNEASFLDLIHVIAGASFRWQLHQYLFMETGLDYSHVFTGKERSGNLRPWLGIGAKF